MYIHTYVCVYIYIYIHTYIYTCTHTHIHVCIMHMVKNICVYITVYVCLYTHICLKWLLITAWVKWYNVYIKCLPQCLAHSVHQCVLLKQEDEKKVCFFFIFLNVSLFLRERETEHKQGKGRERGRHGIWSSCQHRAWCGAQTHEPGDHNLSQSQTPNQLSHPGAPDYSSYIFYISSFQKVILHQLSQLFSCCIKAPSYKPLDLRDPSLHTNIWAHGRMIK